MHHANLEKANLEDASLEEAELLHANLTGTSLRDASLQGAYLGDASMTGADLEDANLTGASLGNASLQGADLEGANLQGADLRRTNLQGTILVKANLQGARLWDANLQGAILGKANLHGARLAGAMLTEAYLGDANLEGADLKHAHMERVKLASANLEGADLRGASVKRADLQQAHLEGADLFDADLEGATLEDADLSRLDLRDTQSIRGIHLYHARLDQTQLTKEQIGESIIEEKEAISKTEARYWLKAKETYLTLKTNFEQIGRYDDASWAYRKERRMEKRETWRLAKDAFQEHDWGSVIRKTWKVGWDLVVEYLCGYGESVGRVLFWMGFVILIAGPLVFGVPGLLRWPKENYDTFFSLSAPRRHAYAYVQHLLYVLDAFTTANFAELQPANALTRFLSALMALIGVFLTGLLGFVAGNRIRRS